MCNILINFRSIYKSPKVRKRERGSCEKIKSRLQLYFLLSRIKYFLQRHIFPADASVVVPLSLAAMIFLRRSFYRFFIGSSCILPVASSLRCDFLYFPELLSSSLSFISCASLVGFQPHTTLYSSPHSSSSPTFFFLFLNFNRGAPIFRCFFIGLTAAVSPALPRNSLSLLALRRCVTFRRIYIRAI